MRSRKGPEFGAFRRAKRLTLSSRVEIISAHHRQPLPFDSKNPLRPIVETTTNLETAPTALPSHGDFFSDVMMPFFNDTFRRTMSVPTAASLFPTELI